MMSMSATLTPLTAADLHALLDRDFRRRSKACNKCQFSLPYRVFSNGRNAGDWTVIPSESCSHLCEAILDELVAEYRSSYMATETGRFHAISP